MKKKLLAIVCLIMALVMSFGCLAGCNLIKTDSEKDVQQVVATVSIEDGIESKMYKLDLIMDYVAYGYQYVQYNGMSMEEALEAIIESRVESMILYQSAMKYLEENGQVINVNKAKWDTSRYLNEENEIDAKYEVYKAISDLLDSYNDSDSSVNDSSNSTESRTAPTNAVPYEEEISFDKKKEYIEKGFDVKSSVEKREAFNKFINFLKVNSLLGDEYVAGKIETTAYFKNNVENARQNEILKKFETAKKNEFLLTYADVNKDGAHNFADVEALYNETLDAQKEWEEKNSVTDFVTALENASATAPVLYSAFGTYGYVYNLLLGVDDTQSGLISKIDAKLSDSERASERAKILETTRIKDLRGAWITSNYDFDFDGEHGTATFTHDYALATKSLPYQGEVAKIREATSEDDKDDYSATPKFFGLDEFISCMHNYMLDGEFVNASVSSRITDEKDDYASIDALKNSVLEAGRYNETITEYDQKINELLFAFSTDSGSLNTYKGYLIKPKVDTGSEQYVETFAEAGRQLLQQGKTNGQSYVIVASDYGYHVMFFSAIYEATGNLYANLTDFLNKEQYDLDGKANWEEYYSAMMADFFEWEDTENYLYVLQNTEVSSKVSSAYNKYISSLIASYRHDQSGKVVINEDTYKDLIK